MNCTDNTIRVPKGSHATSHGDGVAFLLASTCKYPGCHALKVKPKDQRFQYCRDHRGRTHGQRRNERPCQFPHCENSFVPKGRGRYRYCHDHRGKRGSGYRQVPAWRRNVPPGRVGAVHVDHVRIDLAMRGYNVWRAVDNHCPCDLIAGRGSATFRVEVTTGHWTASGKPHINHPKRAQARFSQTNWDVLAIVTETGIVYEPALPDGVSKPRRRLPGNPEQEA